MILRYNYEIKHLNYEMSRDNSEICQNYNILSHKVKNM